MPALQGHAPDHPRLVGNAIATSRLLHLDPARGLAGTRSRWYRLGARATHATGSGDPRAALAAGLHALAALLFGVDVRPIEEVEIQARLARWPRDVLAVARRPGAPDMADRLQRIVDLWPMTGTAPRARGGH